MAVYTSISSIYSTYELLSIIMWLINFNAHIFLHLCMYSQKVKTYIACKAVINVESIFDTHFQIALNT